MLALALARSILAELVLAITKTGLRGHEGIIGKDAGDLWPYSREGGSLYTIESDEENKKVSPQPNSLGNTNRVSSSATPRYPGERLVKKIKQGPDK